VLHGHGHHTVRNYLKSPHGKLPVVGAPSASALGRNHQRRARCFIYRISSTTDGWDVRLSVRVYSAKKNRFIPEYEQQMNVTLNGSV